MEKTRQTFAYENQCQSVIARNVFRLSIHYLHVSTSPTLFNCKCLHILVILTLLLPRLLLLLMVHFAKDLDIWKVKTCELSMYNNQMTTQQTDQIFLIQSIRQLKHYKHKKKKEKEYATQHNTHPELTTVVAIHLQQTYLY